MGVATFSLVFAAFHDYAASLGRWTDEEERIRYARRGDRFWVIGYTLLFLAQADAASSSTISLRHSGAPNA